MAPHGIPDLQAAIVALTRAIAEEGQGRLARIEVLLEDIQQQGIKIMSGLTDLQAAVTTLTSAVSAAAAELTALAAAATGDPDATVETLAQQINAQAAALNAAVAAVTPVVTTPPVTPPSGS
jgi:uncharacterized protein YoxC